MPFVVKKKKATATKKITPAALARAMELASVTYRPPFASQHVRGRGFYKGFGKDIGTGIGALGGGLLGMAGGPLGAIRGATLGSRLGRSLGGAGANVTGFGEYKLRHNSLMGVVPSIKNPRREGATQIRHREYIGDVTSSTGFAIQYALPINAGLSATFPWASQIAQNYTQYEVNGMLFEFVATSGDVTSGTQSLGEVMMSTNYDAVIPAFTSKQQMLNQEFACSTKPSANVIHPIECAPNQTTLPLSYVRSGSVPPNTDQRLYDLGVMYLATSGQQVGGNVLGELWVTYDVLLYKPLLATPGSRPTPGNQVLSYNATGKSAPGGWLPDPGSTVATTTTLDVVINNPLQFTFPVGSLGKWLVTTVLNLPTDLPVGTNWDGAMTVALPAGAGALYPYIWRSGIPTENTAIAPSGGVGGPLNVNIANTAISGGSGNRVTFTFMVDILTATAAVPITYTVVTPFTAFAAWVNFSVIPVPADFV